MWTTKYYVVPDFRGFMTLKGETIKLKNAKERPNVSGYMQQITVTLPTPLIFLEED